MIPKRTPKRVTGSSPRQNRRPGCGERPRSSRSSAFSLRAGPARTGPSASGRRRVCAPRRTPSRRERTVKDTERSQPDNADDPRPTQLDRLTTELLGIPRWTTHLGSPFPGPTPGSGVHQTGATPLYVEVADLRTATLSAVERYLAEARRSHYLDGPNDADWIFRNQALADREDVMYVDYQETDEGFRWHRPSVSQFGSGHYVPQVFQLVAAMRAAGLCHPPGWRS